MRKIFRVIKRGLIGLVIGIGVLIVGLSVNNRIFYVKYKAYDVNQEQPTEDEIREAEEIFSFLAQEGSQIFEDFDDQVDLILFNKKYEFLFTNEVHAGWETLFTLENGKRIERRFAQNSQAFATRLDEKWAGSFHTHGYFNIALMDQVPFFMPPQFLSYDEVGYRSIVIHEMIHAYQGNCDSERVQKAEHLHHIGRRFEQNDWYHKQLEKEGKLLEEALNSNEPMPFIIEFIHTRDDRRMQCEMTEEEIENEQEFEWLEGAGRYGECLVSKGSKSMICQKLDDISEKVKIRGDDRFYTLGMAQILLIKKLNISNWENKLLIEGYTPEEIIREQLDSEKIL